MVAGGSARNVSDVAQSQQAAWLAESLLSSRNSLLVDGWNEDGATAGFKWQVRSIPYNGGVNLYIRIKNRRHGVTVPFDQRSKGFIWFFSFLVWFDAVQSRADA